MRVLQYTDHVRRASRITKQRRAETPHVARRAVPLGPVQFGQVGGGDSLRAAGWCSGNHACFTLCEFTRGPEIVSESFAFVPRPLLIPLLQDPQTGQTLFLAFVA